MSITPQLRARSVSSQASCVSSMEYMVLWYASARVRVSSWCNSFGWGLLRQEENIKICRRSMNEPSLDGKMEEIIGTGSGSVKEMLDLLRWEFGRIKRTSCNIREIEKHYPQSLCHHP
jgi:hypothetical protein